MKIYLTFGQSHAHRVAGITWDADVVCQIEADDEEQARAIAFKAFGDKWMTTYHENKLNLNYFPRGVLPLPEDYNEAMRQKVLRDVSKRNKARTG